MDDILRKYPRLAHGHFAVTSPATRKYNCVAWAAGDDRHWWAPDIAAWWPEAGPEEWSVSGIISVYEMMGYAADPNPAPEAGIEKIAIFALPDGYPTHVARQVESGYWTSKLGTDVDIEHELHGLTGTRFGGVVMIMSRSQRGDVSPTLALRFRSGGV
jgi:hypothetical protein